MSQQQTFLPGNAPFTPNIEFIEGNDGIQVGPNPVTATILLLGDNAQGVYTSGNAGTYTETITVNDATAAATALLALKGVSSFNSAQFDVTGGFVSLLGGGQAIDSVNVDAFTGPGTNPVLPAVDGSITVTGSAVPAGTTPVQTNSLAANTYAVQVQISQAISSTDATKVGLCNFDSHDFLVDANGFVDIKGSANGTGTTVGAVTANVITIPLGAVAGTFQFEARAKGFEATTPAGCGYNIFATFTTDGVTATLVGNQDIFNESPALSAADAYFVASGNNAVLQVLGVTGLTINWNASSQET
jgi:hypothetical protein